MDNGDPSSMDRRAVAFCPVGRAESLRAPRTMPVLPMRGRMLATDIEASTGTRTVGRAVCSATPDLAIAGRPAHGVDKAVTDRLEA
jgi:hypothetical protein